MEVKLGQKTELDMETLYMLPVVTDYSLSVEELLRKADFNDVAIGIDSEHFPTPKTWVEKSYVRVVIFRRSMSPEEVIEELAKRDLRPVDLHTLISFGTQCISLLPYMMQCKPICPMDKNDMLRFYIDYKILALGACHNKSGFYVELRIDNRNEENMIYYFPTEMHGLKTVCPGSYLFAVQKIAPSFLD